MQRAGRAGRVKSGQYLLCSELDIKDRISFPEPEIRRLNLESVILRLIKWKISEKPRITMTVRTKFKDVYKDSRWKYNFRNSSRKLNMLNEKDNSKG